jgi:DNA-binding protein H-NS
MSMRGQQKQHHLELLRKQAEEEAQRRMQERADKYGAIDNKFFEYFGKSAR